MLYPPPLPPPQYKNLMFGILTSSNAAAVAHARNNTHTCRSGGGGAHTHTHKKTILWQDDGLMDRWIGGSKSAVCQLTFWLSLCVLCEKLNLSTAAAAFAVWSTRNFVLLRVQFFRSVSAARKNSWIYKLHSIFCTRQHCCIVSLICVERERVYIFRA